MGGGWGGGRLTGRQIVLLGIFVVLTTVMWGCLGGTALAASTAPSPGPGFSPPPGCFVMKDNALPTCEQNTDGTWTAIYPNGSTTTVRPSDDASTGSEGTSDTTRDIEIAIVVLAILGIGGIVYWQWGPHRRPTA